MAPMLPVVCVCEVVPIEAPEGRQSIARVARPWKERDQSSPGGAKVTGSQSRHFRPSGALGFGLPDARVLRPWLLAAAPPGLGKCYFKTCAPSYFLSASFKSRCAYRAHFQFFKRFPIGV